MALNHSTSAVRVLPHEPLRQLNKNTSIGIDIERRMVPRGNQTVLTVSVKAHKINECDKKARVRKQKRAVN